MIFYINLTKNAKSIQLAMYNCCKKRSFMVAYSCQGMALMNYYAPQYLPSGIVIGKEKVKLRKGMILYEQT